MLIKVPNNYNKNINDGKIFQATRRQLHERPDHIQQGTIELSLLKTVENRAEDEDSVHKENHITVNDGRNETSEARTESKARNVPRYP